MSIETTPTGRALIAAALRDLALRLEASPFQHEHLPATSAANVKLCRELAELHMPQGGQRRSVWTANVGSTASHTGSTDE